MENAEKILRPLGIYFMSFGIYLWSFCIFFRFGTMKNLATLLGGLSHVVYRPKYQLFSCQMLK
jgi:hypothetical protein